MNKIVLAVSDRWTPDARVDSIADFAARLGHPIIAVHVAYGTEGSGADTIPGEQILEQIATRLRNKGIKVETLMLFSDDLGEAILKTADEHHATMLILGLSSKGMLTRLIEGNVANQIIRGARMPVLLLPPDWSAPI
ncbi:MAG: universal stress protein [Phycisphaerae bacterium]